MYFKPSITYKDMGMDMDMTFNIPLKVANQTIEMVQSEIINKNSLCIKL